MFLFGLITLASLLSVVAIHEGGHALVARLLGGTARLRWWPTPQTVAAWPGELSSTREAMYFLAGPAANVLVGVALLFVPSDFGAAAGLLHIVFAALSLLPTSLRNDGGRALALLRRR